MCKRHVAPAANGKRPRCCMMNLEHLELRIQEAATVVPMVGRDAKAIDLLAGLAAIHQLP